MDELENILLTGYDRYYTHLSQFGTVKKKNQNALLITLYLYQLLYGPMSVFITNQDYNTIDRLLHSLNGTSCLIDYYKYCQKDSMFKWNEDDDPAKILEIDRSVRVTKMGDVRYHIL